MREPVLQIENMALNFVQHDAVHAALKGISLEVHVGEIVGVAGESGSGKSVTAMSILRLLPPSAHLTADRASVFDRDVRALKKDDLQNMRGAQVAIVFQEPMTALNPVLTIGDQMCDVIVRHTTKTRAEALALAQDLLGDMKIDEPVRALKSYPHELSGGMRQRVLIAMAFSCRPRLIIADEPTTALDVTVQAQILALLKERAHATGTAVLLISHDLAVIAQLCDRLYVMHQGNVVESGPAGVILRRPQHPYTQALLDALPDGKAPRTRLSVSSPATTSTRTYNATRPPMLSVRAASVRYPRDRDVLGRATTFHTAVDEVSFDILEGETLSLVGESGCGKTSLAHAVVGLVPLAAGDIVHHGAGDTDPRRNGTTRDVQIVFQDPQGSLDPRWPIWRIVTEPLTVDSRLSRAELHDRAADLCRRVGLDPNMLQRHPHEFSGGQRQRIAIARALSVEPRLLVLDEPTSALDVSIQAQILNLLLDLQDEKGLTYLFISHNVAVVRHISDRVAVMHRGRIVEQGPARDVLSAPTHPYTRTLMDAVPRLTF